MRGQAAAAPSASEQLAPLAHHSLSQPGRERTRVRPPARLPPPRAPSPLCESASTHSPGGRVPEFGTRTGAPFEFRTRFKSHLVSRKCCGSSVFWLGERPGGGRSDSRAPPWTLHRDAAVVAQEHHRLVRGADRGTRSLEGGPVPQLAGEHHPQALHL